MALKIQIIIAFLVTLFSTSAFAADPAPALIRTLQEGGNVLLFRVPESIMGSDRVVFSSRNFEYCEEQRTLSPRGMEDARTIGEAIRHQGIHISEVVSSAYCRTLQSSSIAFPEQSIQINRQLNSICRESTKNMAGFSEELLRRIQAPVDQGNRIIMGHQCNIQYLLKRDITAFESDRLRLSAGEALVIRPGDDSFQIIGIITLKTWYQWAEKPFNKRPE